MQREKGEKGIKESAAFARLDDEGAKKEGTTLVRFGKELITRGQKF